MARAVGAPPNKVQVRVAEAPLVMVVGVAVKVEITGATRGAA
mgnify:CR=1 FL=1